LSDESVDQISQRTGKEYKQLGIELGLSTSVIDNIACKDTTLVYKARTVLKTDHGFTYRDIGQAIVEVNMDTAIIYDCYQLWKNVS